MMLQNVPKQNARLSAVPDLVDFVAGEFAAAIVKIWKDGDVGEYLTAASAQRHIWHAVIAATDFERLPCRKLLTEQRRKRILKEAYGSYAPGMIGLLSRLGPRAETKEFYRAVHLVLSRGDAVARTLQHSKTVDPRIVLAVAELPEDFISSRMAGYAIRRGVSACDIAEMAWLVRRFTDKTGSISVLNTLSNSRNPVITLRRAIANLAFPEPPWEASGLIPINSADQLSEIARRFDNCLRDHDIFYAACVDVQAGIAFYFATSGPEPLLLKFSKFGDLGWFLDECRGKENRSPTVVEVDRIAALVGNIDNVRCRRLSYEMR